MFDSIDNTTWAAIVICWFTFGFLAAGATIGGMCRETAYTWRHVPGKIYERQIEHYPSMLFWAVVGYLIGPVGLVIAFAVFGLDVPWRIYPERPQPPAPPETPEAPPEVPEAPPEVPEAPPTVTVIAVKDIRGSICRYRFHFDRRILDGLRDRIDNIDGIDHCGYSTAHSIVVDFGIAFDEAQTVERIKAAIIEFYQQADAPPKEPAV